MYVVSGTCEVKKVVEMIPQILPQLGPDNLENLKNFATQFQKAKSSVQEDEDDVPALVENVNFEEVATGGAAAADTKDDDSVPELADAPEAGAAVPKHEIA